MTSSNTNLPQVLLQFSRNYLDAYSHAHGHLPLVEADEDWPSPCEQGSANDKECYWQPVEIAQLEQQQDISFSNVESALEMTLHPDIHCYFTTLYSESINARSDDGKLSLLFAWNFDDFQRLQENIIGHILMKRKLKQAETIFFAVTDAEDIIVSLDNVTGEVWVERVGCKPHKKLADSLADYIKQLTPEV